MISKKALKQYVESIGQQKEADQALYAALKSLNGDNYFVSTQSDKNFYAMKEIFIEIMGAEKYEWLEWWLYEGHFGEMRKFSIENKEYETNDFELFYDLILSENV